MKLTRSLYEAFTVFWGWQQDLDDPPLELRVCKLCGSTLSDGTRQVAHAA